ncbi:MAG TPA: carboxypeptidase regulatory-like domain-containing protein [Thermoplasmata archaeon]|nr:carboxypeptidase regulatory-like domain-containing protein [Thermoplasmata archaeon]
MQGSQLGWWRRHGWTVAILLGAFGMAFAIRTIWTYPIIQQFGPLYTYAGGSDSYYHSRVTTYIILNHANLVFDPLIHFPIGGYNPREPLFDWMNAILGLVFAPAFGGNAVVAGAWFLDLQAPLWAALEVFPIYLIGREVSSKRMGLIAALIFPFLSASIDSSIFGYANYLSFYTFVILVTIYAYLRTVKAVGTRRWVASYRDPKQYLPGLRGFWRTERTAIKWAVFTGVSLGALALAWQGYTYAIVVIGISLVILMVVERIRRVDSFGLYVATAITGLIAFPMAAPYYIVQHQFSAWFDLPLILFFGTLGLMLPFLLLRDVPWIFSIPALVGLVGLAALFLFVFEPRYFTSIVTGQGYFVKTLIYSTVAEAQAPSFDQLVVGYGIVTFFLAFAGIGLFVWKLIRGRFRRQHVVFLVFGVLSIYLPISAAKFFLLGSPAFALLPAEAIERALDVAGYPALRRTVASLSDRGSQFAAFRKAFKARHVLIFLLILVIVLPNVWVGIDAGIPSNTKAQASEQVYDSLPSWLKGNATTDQNYFGAAGTSLDTSNQYDSAGYNWLATQDTSAAPQDRPAFVSWWDYGFQAIDQGQHPSVADNFQNGIDPAGQFLLAQNESSAIAVLATTLLQAEQLKTGLSYLPAALNTILARDGLNVTQLHNYLVNESMDYALVVAHPERYLPVDPTTLTLDNAMYMAVSYFIASSLPLSGVASLYNDIQAYTGWSIRYDMADSRLIPFSGQDTGIYYAPADLTGRIINAAGDPQTYFNVTVLGSDGNTYPLGDVPADVAAVSYTVNYFAPFFNSIIYRTYFGYNGTDIGQGFGIPGLEGAVASDPVEPGWMLQHFMVVYKTAYYCPSAAEAAVNSGCYTAMNQPSALNLQKTVGGIANTSAYRYFSGGESILEYYPGQTVLGNLVLPNGAPVGGARVTVFDQWGIPHMSVTTAPDGSFSIVLPPGNDTLNVTTGALQGLTQQGATLLQSIPITVPSALALSFTPPNLPMTITLRGGTVSGLVYWNTANSTTYEPSTDRVVPGAQVVLWGAGNLSKITATTDASGSFDLANVPPGIYDYDVLYAGHNFTQSALTITPGGATNASAGLAVGAIKGTVLDPLGNTVSGAFVTLGNASGTVASETTNSSGGFSFTAYAPGNYTLSAAVPGTANVSAGVPVVIANAGSGFAGNLTVRPTVSVAVTVSAAGTPIAGLPVRFTPVPVFTNTTISPLTIAGRAATNGTVVLTGADGVATARLPFGNYSVSVIGYVGTTLDSGLASVTTSALSPSVGLAVPLSRAIRLAGAIVPVGPVTNQTTFFVSATSAAGAPSYTWAVNGTYAFYLPSGSYSVLGLGGTTTAGSTVYAALTSVSLSAPTNLPLVPSVAVAAHFSIGSRLANGKLFHPAAATATVSAGSGGANATALSTASGTLIAYVPSVVPAPATTYCLTVAAAGFATTSECGLSPNGLGAITVYPVALSPVTVNLRIVGGPPGGIRVNFTATTETGTNTSLVGGPSFTTGLSPGLYSVTGWAPTGNGSTLYLPSRTLNVALGIGAASANLTMLLVNARNSTGTLALPSGGAAANVTVALSSPLFNATVNGTAFTHGFYAPAGRYSALATLSAGGVQYASLVPLTIGAGGTATPTLSVTGRGVEVTGSLQRSTNTTLLVAVPLTLTSTSGATVALTTASGTFSADLPTNTTFSVGASALTSELSSAGAYTVSWTARPGTTCSIGTNSTRCPVPMVPTTDLVWLNGTLSATGVPGLVSGTVRLLGPFPYDNLTIVAAPSGTFSTQVLPGTYSIYASGGGGSEPLAGFASAPASLSAPSSLALALTPTWTATVLVVSPSAAAPLLGPANVTLTNSFGVSVVYPGVAPGVPFTVALPAGTYSARASSFGVPYGVATTATALVSFSVSNGNVGVTLALAYESVLTAAVTPVGSSTATITSPGTAVFAFAMVNTGNAPLLVHPVGSPSTWGFTFSFANATLAPGAGAGTTSAAVSIAVPGATSTLHPPVVIELALANGTVVGAFSPTVRIVPTFGVAVGAAVASRPTVGPTSALVPFYLANTGNSLETVRLSIVDLPRLEAYGWSATFLSASGPLGANVSLDPFENASYNVSLSASAAVFVPAGFVTVQASVVNESGAYQAAAALNVPLASVKASTTNGTAPILVTGPGVTSPPSGLPDWFVPLVSFVPAIALVVGVLAYRWWRTRRWTRR